MNEMYENTNCLIFQQQTTLGAYLRFKKEFRILLHNYFQLNTNYIQSMFKKIEKDLTEDERVILHYMEQQEAIKNHYYQH